MRTLPNLIKDRAGTSALEFAIIAPLFFLILFTLIAYGIYLSVTHAVQQVAADAARTAVAGLNPAERILLVNHYLNASHFDYAFLDRGPDAGGRHRRPVQPGAVHRQDRL